MFNPGTAGLGSWTAAYSYTDSNGCSDTSMVTIAVNACTGVMENTLANATIVFPNPNNGTFTLLVNSDENAMLIELVDVSGRTVFSSDEKDVHAGFRKEITAESLSGGIYMLRLTANDDQVMMKISVQK